MTMNKDKGQVLTDEQRQAVEEAAGYFSRSWKSEDAKLANKLRTILAAATQAQPEVKVTRFESDPKEHQRVIEGVDKWLAAYNLPTYSQLAAPTTGKREPLTLDGIAKALSSAGLLPEDYREDGQIEPLVRAIERAHGITGEQR